MPAWSFDIIGRDKASPAFASASSGADRLHSRIGTLASGFGHLAKAAAVTGGLAALGGVIAVFKTGIDEQKDFLAGQAQLASGIKSTGNAAHVSVKGLEDLASSVQNYSGQSDDSIVASEKLLLTFTNIRNSAGKNNDVFTQATKVTADMAAKMGGDASKYAIQLGKALNDPVKGLTALTKIGVSFSAGQKEQVKHLVATGHTMEAQKLIIKELNREFGGAAKAAGQSLPGQLERAKRAFEDIAQSVLAALMPVLVRVASFISKTVMPAFGGFISALQGEGITSNGLVGFMERIGVAVRAVWSVISNAWPKIRQIIATAWSRFIQPALAATVAFIRDRLIPAFRAAVGWVVAHWPQIRAVFVTVWRNIKPLIAAFGDLLKTVWNSVLKPLVAWVQRNWPAIQKVAKAVFIVVAVAAKVLVVALTAAFKSIAIQIRVVSKAFQLIDGAFRATYRAVKGIGENVVGFFRNLPGRIRGIFSHAGTWLLEGGKNIVRGMFNGIKGAFGAVAGWFKDLPKHIMGLLGIHSPPKWGIEAGKWIMKAMLHGLVHGAGAIGTYLKGFASTVGGLILGAGDKPSTQIWSWITEAMSLTGVSADWGPAIFRRIMFESGGNPRAINLSDDNAKRGTPSKGLMQVIQPTFDAYSLHRYGLDRDIYNPVGNIAAAINYIKARYQNIFAIDPPVQGYKTGAWRIPADQLAFLHRGEMVVPSLVANMVRGMGGPTGSHVRSPARGGGDTYVVQVDVRGSVRSDKEITDLVTRGIDVARARRGNPSSILFAK